MADYWKSLPRKFCEFCKCWITDNKPSIEFHERGKKHQENVQKKIAELRKKGQKDYEEERSMQKMLKKMEEAALKSFKKDVEENPELASQIPTSTTTLPLSSETKLETVPNKNSGQRKQKKKKHGNRVWYEGISDDGYRYYWNSVTGVSSWDPPNEGYVSLADQQDGGKNSKNSSKDKTKKTPSVPSSFGPKPRQDPYGQWVAVNSNVAEEVDLQLPEQKEQMEFKISAPPEETVKFKERVIKSLNDSCSEDTNVEFKKRKLNSNFKRNIRRKDDSEEY